MEVGLHGHLLPGGWLPQVPPLLPPRRQPLPDWPAAAVAGLADAPELEATWNPGKKFQLLLIEEEYVAYKIGLQKIVYRKLFMG